MKRSKMMYAIVAAGALTGIFFVVVFFSRETGKEIPDFPHPGERTGHEFSSEGIEEDRGGRKAFELLRHASPATDRVPVHARSGETRWMERLVKAQASARSKTQMADLPRWTCIGPDNLGGRTKALAIDMSDPLQKTILAGCVTGGMWRTADGGNTWQKTTTAAQIPTVSCVAQDTRPGHEQTWYFGTGELFNASDPDNDNGLLRGNGIYRSADGGRSWQVLPSTSTDKQETYDNPFDYVWDVAVDVSNIAEDEIYAATIGGIFRSADGGNTWKKVLGTSANSGRYTDLVITSAGVVYSSVSNMTASPSQSGIFRSADGLTWESITPPWWPKRFNRTLLAVCSSNEGKIYAVTDLSTTNRIQHLLCVYQEGSGWRDLTSNLPDYEGYDEELGDYNSQLSFSMTLAVKPDDENVVFLGGVNLYRSTDGFSTADNTEWIGGYDGRKKDRSKYPAHHPDQQSLAFFKNPKRMLSGHDGGISLLEENLAKPAVWKSLNNGYVTSQFYTVAMNHARGDDVVLGGMQDNGSFYDANKAQGGQWRSLLAGDGSFCAISNNGNHYYASSQYSRIYRLDFSQGAYRSFARVDPPGELPYLFINPFVLDPYNSNLLYMAGGNYIWRNDNASAIPAGSDDPTSLYWKKLEQTRITGVITALGVSTAPGNILYYGTSRGQLFRLDHAESEGPAATEITGGVFPKYFGNPAGYISSIAVDPFDARRLLVTFSNYEVMSVFFSHDSGGSWEAVAGNLEARNDGGGAGPAVYTAAMLHKKDGTVYFVGTSAGLFYTSSLEGMNTTWSWDASIGNIPVEMVVCRQVDGTVLAATHGYGVHTAQFPDFVRPEFQPLTFSIGQSYPNPVHPGQTFLIPVSLDEDMPVQINLHDASGKFLRSLANEEMKGGKHILEFSSSGLAPGVYYVVGKTGMHGRTVSRMVVE